MKTTINFYQFCDSFSDAYKNNFSYDGKRALFDYLEQYEEDSGEEIEIDTVALCCGFSEHSSALEAAKEYSDFEESFSKDYEDEENLEEQALEYLREHTLVIEFDSGIIIQAF